MINLSSVEIVCLKFPIFPFISFLILKSLEENVVYFFSPTEIYNKSDISFGKKIRLGGLVKEGSTSKKEATTNFIITDLKNQIGLLHVFFQDKGEGCRFFGADLVLLPDSFVPPIRQKIIKRA